VTGLSGGGKRPLSGPRGGCRGPRLGRAATVGVSGAGAAAGAAVVRGEAEAVHEPAEGLLAGLAVGRGRRGDEATRTQRAGGRL